MTNKKELNCEELKRVNGGESDSTIIDPLKVEPYEPFPWEKRVSQNDDPLAPENLHWV